MLQAKVVHYNFYNVQRCNDFPNVPDRWHVAKGRNCYMPRERWVLRILPFQDSGVIHVNTNDQ